MSRFCKSDLCAHLASSLSRVRVDRLLAPSVSKTMISAHTPSGTGVISLAADGSFVLIFKLLGNDTIDLERSPMAVRPVTAVYS
jgi:hypothetical protein